MGAQLTRREHFFGFVATGLFFAGIVWWLADIGYAAILFGGYFAGAIAWTTSDHE